MKQTNITMYAQVVAAGFVVLHMFLFICLVAGKMASCVLRLERALVTYAKMWVLLAAAVVVAAYFVERAL